MNNPMKMMKQVQEMQARMAKVQEELERETVEGTAGGGAVRVIVTGAQKVTSVSIDAGAGGDVEMLQDLVMAAINDGLERSRQLAASKMQAVAGGLGLPPGLI